MTKAVESGERAMAAIHAVVASLQKAYAWAQRRYWLINLVCMIPAYIFWSQARRRAQEASLELESFQSALQRLGLEHSARLALRISLEDVTWGVVDDLSCDTPDSHSLADEIASNRVRANISLSRVRRVVRGLQGALKNTEPDSHSHP